MEVGHQHQQKKHHGVARLRSHAPPVRIVTRPTRTSDKRIAPTAGGTPDPQIQAHDHSEMDGSTPNSHHGSRIWVDDRIDAPCPTAAKHQHRMLIIKKDAFFIARQVEQNGVTLAAPASSPCTIADASTRRRSSVMTIASTHRAVNQLRQIAPSILADKSTSLTKEPTTATAVLDRSEHATGMPRNDRKCHSPPKASERYPLSSLLNGRFAPRCPLR